MKTFLLSALLFATINPSVICQSSKPKTVAINTSKSIINWEGSMLFSFGGHHGTVNFKEGNLTFTNDKITGGYFIADMNTIKNTDGDYSSDLVNHLKNEDFFNVGVHPTATLKIVKSEYYDNGTIRMDGELTIKGITKKLNFEAILNSSKNLMTARMKIDRTDWNIMYGAKGVVNVKDHAISDAIVFNVDVYY